LQHVLFFDGNSEKISWVIQTDNSIAEQKREHAEIYRNKVTVQQSKYIGLHVGLFWGIGTFIIKDQDTIRVILDDKTMFEYLTAKEKNYDKFIERRVFFFNSLVEQRKLKIQYILIEPDKNLASKII
jgi:hypothetical protein